MFEVMVVINGCGMWADSSRGKALRWETRLEIILGTAEGLAYLHENSNTRIIHRDIKASNILLDSRLGAKIADFGLARSFQEDKTHISTAIAGTLLVFSILHLAVLCYKCIFMNFYKQGIYGTRVFGTWAADRKGRCV